MDFAFSDEQEELRRTVRSFLADKSPETEVRRLMETTEGYEPKVWQQMGEQIGLQGLAIPEEFGGSGYTFLETGVVLEEMGRALLCAPYFATAVLAANTLLLSDDDAAKAEYLPGIAGGETIAHPGTHRGRRPLGRHRHQARCRQQRRQLDPDRHQDVRAGRPHRRCDPGRCADR